MVVASVVVTNSGCGCIEGIGGDGVRCVEATGMVVARLVVTNRSSRPVVTNSGCIDVIGEAALGIRQLRSEIH